MIRRLEDKIRVLCAKAVATQDTPEFHEIVEELRMAIHEQTKHLRATVINPRIERRR
jgi:hypothetical protein